MFRLIFASVSVFLVVILLLVILLLIAKKYLSPSGVVRISINDGKKELDVRPGSSLLSTLAEHNVYLSSAWKCCCCYGGHSMSEERKVLSTMHPAVVIGTPGRITDHLSKGTILTDSIEYLVIDEFDKSLEYGFQEEMEMIIGQLHHLKKRILASATDTEEIPNFVEMSHTVRLDFLKENADIGSRIRLMKVLSPEKDKINTLYRLLCHLKNSSSIVFCNHREAVDRVSNLLRELGFPNERYHAPVYDFVAPDDGFGHQFWIIDNDDDIATITAEFVKMSSLYIADGHHRSAAAALVGAEKAKQNPHHTGKEEYNYFMLTTHSVYSYYTSRQI